jgi:hypothetical protein
LLALLLAKKTREIQTLCLPQETGNILVGMSLTTTKRFAPHIFKQSLKNLNHFIFWSTDFLQPDNNLLPVYYHKCNFGSATPFIQDANFGIAYHN